MACCHRMAAVITVQNPCTSPVLMFVVCRQQVSWYRADSTVHDVAHFGETQDFQQTSPVAGVLAEQHFDLARAVSASKFPGVLVVVPMYYAPDSRILMPKDPV